MTDRQRTIARVVFGAPTMKPGPRAPGLEDSILSGSCFRCERRAIGTCISSTGQREAACIEHASSFGKGVQ